MQKIIINATNIGKRLDGIGVYTLNIIRELVKSPTNINFIIVLNRNSKEHIQDIQFPENFSIRWITRHLSPDYGFMGHLLRLIYSNLISLRYRNFLIFNTSQIEAVYLRTNQIITIHDVIPLLFKKYQKKQYYYYKYILKHALKKARAIITPSAHTKGLLESIYKLDDKKIFVVHNGLQEVFLSKKNNTNPIAKEDFIIYIGRISPTKNLLGLLKAFILIKDKIHHKLLIVGSGKERLLKDKVCKKLYEDINDRVIFKGYVPNIELLTLYEKASLFVFPSFYEGFGLPPLEAMACGCPVVVSNVASLPEVCGDAAYYVDPYNVESIAEGMYKVLTDNTLRKSLIEKGLERAKLFSWEKSAKEHIKVFEEVLNS
ncbi:MAG: glycosyltransferase family 4 protein [Thermodesulfovibrionales bacterium]